MRISRDYEDMTKKELLNAIDEMEELKDYYKGEANKHLETKKELDEKLKRITNFEDSLGESLKQGLKEREETYGGIKVLLFLIMCVLIWIAIKI